MLTFAFGEKFPSPCALVLGGFDGLHLGHRALLQRAKESGLPVVLTTMLGGKGKALFTKKERELVFSRAGVDAVCEIVLDAPLRALSPETFLETLFASVKAELLFAGEDFRFGKDAAGTPALLSSLAPCPVEVVPLVTAAENGKKRKLSTSFCKECLRRGELEALNASLCSGPSEFFGGAYFIGGEVVHGRAVGRTYGFPTLNLLPPPEKLLPPAGVYMGRAETEKGRYPCILNLGARPTFGEEGALLEAHLEGFSGDLYGTDAQIYPEEFLRPIQKFANAEALKARLERDTARLKERYQ